MQKCSFVMLTKAYDVGTLVGAIFGHIVKIDSSGLLADATCQISRL